MSVCTSPDLILMEKARSKARLLPAVRSIVHASVNRYISMLAMAELKNDRTSIHYRRKAKYEADRLYRFLKTGRI